MITSLDWNPSFQVTLNSLKNKKCNLKSLPPIIMPKKKGNFLLKMSWKLQSRNSLQNSPAKLILRISALQKLQNSSRKNQNFSHRKNKRIRTNFLDTGGFQKTKDIIGFLKFITALSSTVACGVWIKYLPACQNSSELEKHSNVVAIIKKCKKSTRHLPKFFWVWGKPIMTHMMKGSWKRIWKKIESSFSKIYWRKNFWLKIETKVSQGWVNREKKSRKRLKVQSKVLSYKPIIMRKRSSSNK